MLIFIAGVAGSLVTAHIANWVRKDYPKSVVYHKANRVMQNTFYDGLKNIKFWRFSMVGDVPIFVQPISENEEFIDYMMNLDRFSLIEQDYKIKCRGTLPSGYVRLKPMDAYSIHVINEDMITEGRKYVPYPNEIKKVVRPNW